MLAVGQVTDVYTLENFAHFQTLLEETREKAKGAVVVCMLTGDFLSPYLLSSVDRGAGMMRALARIPMDYLTWGNHEADISHSVGKLEMSCWFVASLLVVLSNRADQCCSPQSVVTSDPSQESGSTVTCLITTPWMHSRSLT